MWGIDVQPPSKAPSIASQDSTAHPARQFFAMSAVSSQSSQQFASSRPTSASGCPEPPPPKKRMAKQLVKTQLCKHFWRGYCRYQEKCAYAHCADELVPKPDLQKTKVCVRFLSGTCMNLNCSYAHGLEELRLESSSHGGSEVGSAISAVEKPRSSYAFAHEEQAPSSAPPGLFAPQAWLEKFGNVPVAAFAAGCVDHRIGKPMLPHPQADPMVMNEDLRQLAMLQSQLTEERQISEQTAATQNWGNLVQAQLREQRKRYYAQGKVLLESDRRQDPLSFLEEQMLASILLGDRYWGGAFPELTHRCGTMLATRLLSNLQQEALGQGRSPPPSLVADGPAFQVGPRGAPYSHPPCTRPLGAPSRFALDSATGHGQSLHPVGGVEPGRSPYNPQACTKASGVRDHFVLDSATRHGQSLNPAGLVEPRMSHPQPGRMDPQSKDLLRHPGASQLNGIGRTEAVPYNGSSTLAHRQCELLDMDTLWMSDSSRQTSSDAAEEPMEATPSYDATSAMLLAGGPGSAFYPMTATIPQGW